MLLNKEADRIVWVQSLPLLALLFVVVIFKSALDLLALIPQWFQGVKWISQDKVRTHSCIWSNVTELGQTKWKIYVAGCLIISEYIW